MLFIYNQALLAVLYMCARVSGIYAYVTQLDVGENSHAAQNATSDCQGELWSRTE